jgi:hypothetical protein
MIAIMDPRHGDAEMVGEGHAPLWQYFAGVRRKGGDWTLVAG